MKTNDSGESRHVSFSALGLSSHLTAALDAMGITSPTPIQNEAIAHILQGRDVLAMAPTGSGKTAAYVLPLLQHWSSKSAAHRSTSLILLPTRELVKQVHEVIQQLAVNLSGIKTVSLHGGVSINPQLQQLRGGADIVLATPGRLLDVVQHNGLDLESVATLVLDEADRLLDAGFADEFNAVLGNLRARQCLMFSATLSGKVAHTARQMLTDSVTINLVEASGKIVHRAIEIDNADKTALLIQLVGEHGKGRTLVFTANRKGAEKLAQQLTDKGLIAAALHGKLAQSKREQILESLKSGSLKVLIATDLAARGIDIAVLSLVINYDLPRTPQLYTHRAGRTGRSGHQGQAISFIDANGQAHFKLLEKRLGLSIPREQREDYIPSDKPDPRLLVSDSQGGIKGKRISKKDKIRAAMADKADKRT